MDVTTSVPVKRSYYSAKDISCPHEVCEYIHTLSIYYNIEEISYTAPQERVGEDFKTSCGFKVISVEKSF